jgi:excisionase family DNA binding protein
MEFNQVSGKIKNNNSKPELLNAIATAEVLGISRAHLYRLHNAGKIPLPMRLGGAVRWRLKELMAWIDAGMPNRSRWQNMTGGAA